MSQKPSLPAALLRPVGLEEQKLPSGVGVRYLYQPGELEGGRRRAAVPVWSLEVYRFGRSVIEPDEPVLYYQDTACSYTVITCGPARGFVREELLVVAFDIQLPPPKFLRNKAPLYMHSSLADRPTKV